MEETCKDYLQQICKARETIDELESKISYINSILDNNSNSSYYLYELKKLKLDLVITQNELEHCIYNFERCKGEKFKNSTV